MDENILLKGAGIVLEQNDRLIKEHDETRTWTIQIAKSLQVKLDGFKTDDIAGQWKELRKRILSSLKDKKNA